MFFWIFQVLMNYCTDLILGKAFCTFIFFHFPDAELSVLTGLHFYFWWHDKENTEYNTIQYAPLHLLLFSSKNKNPTIIVWHYLVFLHPVFSMSIKIVCTKSVESFESGRFVLINITLFAPLKTAWNLFSWTVPFNSSTSLARAFSTSSSSSSSSLELLGWSPCRLCSGPYNWSAYWKLLP